MTAAHIHLLFNHFPIIGGLIGLGLLAYGWWYRNDQMVRAACVILLVMALFTAVTFLSGEPAENELRGVPGFARDMVHAHEEAADWTLWLYVPVGLLSLYILVRHARRAIPRVLSSALLVLLLITAAAAIRTGLLGGRISHPEVRSGFVAAPAGAAAELDED